MQKQIILIDRDLRFIDEFLESNYHIVVLIVDSDSMAQDCKLKYQNNPQITHILSMQDLEYVDGTPYLNYELIQEFKEAQYKIEFVAHRWLNDGMLSSNKFFNALGWWNQIFDTFDISFVLIRCIEHGVTYDIPAYIAKARGIPAFFTPPTLIYATSILHYNTNTYIPLTGGHLSQEQIEENLFCTFNPDDIMLPTAKSLWKKQKSLIRKSLFKVGGQVLVDFVTCLLNRDFTIKQHTGYFPVSFWHRLYCLLYVKKMKRFYDKHAVMPDYEQKFIFYAMHFEPEGGTSVCVPLQNQLTIIQMLHNALPKGWKLYVKEHPHQFILNNPEMVYFLYNLKWWKSIEFYKELQKLPNCELICFDTPSKELIHKAKALATINGTIHIESTFHNKPCVVFGGKNLLLQNARNLIYVHSFQNLKDSLTLLEEQPSSFDNQTSAPPHNLSKPTPHITNPQQWRAILSHQYRLTSPYEKLSKLHLATIHSIAITQDLRGECYA